MITAAVAGLENTEGLGHFSGKFIFARSLIVFVVVFLSRGPFFFEVLDAFFLLEFALSPRRRHVLLIPHVEPSIGDFRLGKFFLRYGSGSSGSK